MTDAVVSLGITSHFEVIYFALPISAWCVNCVQSSASQTATHRIEGRLTIGQPSVFLDGSTNRRAGSDSAVANQQVPVYADYPASDELSVSLSAGRIPLPKRS